MGLSSDLISQFVKVTNDNTKPKTETTVYGTIVERDDSLYVRLDGSDILTPMSQTSKVKDGDRVTVMIKNHSAIVTGNLTDPSASNKEVGAVQETLKNANLDDISNKISEFEIIIADAVTTEELDVEIARIDNLAAETVTIRKSLDATSARITNLESSNVTITGKVTANEGNILKLSTDKLDAAVAVATYAKITDLNATNATVHNLSATYGDFASLTSDRLMAAEAVIDSLDTNYANVDFSNIGKAAMEYFYSKSGLIKNVVVGDQTITGSLVGVTIKGDLIEGGTVVAEKLVLKGEDGLYYKLNTDGVTIEAEQTDYNSLNGSIITAKSITANKISVDDLVAFDATIGGFNITENSLYSGVKESVGNTTRGVYLDNTGQVAFGDASNFVKYYKASDGSYKLAISANSLVLSASNKNVETAISDVQTAVNNIEVGGRNLLLNTDFDGVSKYYECIKADVTEGGFHFTPSMQIESGVQYTLSARIRGNANVTFYQINTGGNVSTRWIKRADLSETEYRRYTITFSVLMSRVFNRAYICTQWGEANTSVGDWFEIEPRSLKLEKGNKATDWTPAPEDLESATKEAQTTADSALAVANQNAADMASVVTNFNADIQSLQTQIDGSITSWFYEAEPTTSNEPAVNWTTTDLKNVHLGDLYYNTITGYCYRWQVLNNIYSWQRITDTDVTKALSDARSAQDTADQKRRVFYAQPSPPYDAGDLWVQGAGGDILRCQVTKTAGQSYITSDWVAASKYTDDTMANTANQNAVAAQSTADKAVTAANNAQNDIDELAVGGRNYLIGSEEEQYNSASSRAEYLKTTFDLAPFFDENGLIEVTLSFDAYAPVAGDLMVYSQNGSGSRYQFSIHFNVTTEWTRYAFTFKPSGPDESQTESYLAFYGVYDSGIVPHVRKLKLEKGNKATDWTLAPEEMATAKEVDTAQNTADEANSKADDAKTLIAQLSDSISMLVTDGNGTSLMSQTDDGWTFSTADIQSSVSDISETLNALVTDVGDVNGVVDVLQQAVADLGEIAEYVKIGTYEDEPCIELGEGDSEFKLRITNTRMVFTEGANVLAYFNNQALNIKKAVVEEELQQGGFVWKARSNGNLGLTWKGGNG